MNEISWTDYNNQSCLAIGWYSVLFSWDSEEGSFVQANYFDGDSFEEILPIFSISSVPFATKEDAEEWGAANDS
jgi:hypothetical protein